MDNFIIVIFRKNGEIFSQNLDFVISDDDEIRAAKFLKKVENQGFVIKRHKAFWLISCKPFKALPPAWMMIFRLILRSLIFHLVYQGLLL